METIPPKVSIIMGIYNCAKTLPKAIDSILAQTFTDWELIMCDDGSADNTLGIAERYAEKYSNIIVLKNETNIGLPFTLNHCLKYVTGLYIARQDGDDESLPTRLEKEVAFLDTHPQHAIVSTAMIYFDEHGDWGQGYPVEEPTKFHFIKGTPFAHAPSMVRREAYLSVGGYSEGKRFLRGQDYHLWAKMYAKGYRGFNIREPLYRMLDDRQAKKRRTFKTRWNAFLVRNTVFHMLKLPLYYRIYTLKPLLVGVLPSPLYNYLHKKRLRPRDH